MTVSPDTQITELTANDHACLTFGEPAELLDLTAAFIRDGWLAGLKVVWVTDLALAGWRRSLRAAASRWNRRFLGASWHRWAGRTGCWASRGSPLAGRWAG